mmetsp:Transcript_56952/g.152025  ORF Transcript_56952/g.152025 Transcript_56952/m.152025 type:complete len:395 (+) Transcript_56952:640-1824(+)
MLCMSHRFLGKLFFQLFRTGSDCRRRGRESAVSLLSAVLRNPRDGLGPPNLTKKSLLDATALSTHFLLPRVCQLTWKKVFAMLLLFFRQPFLELLRNSLPHGVILRALPRALLRNLNSNLALQIAKCCAGEIVVCLTSLDLLGEPLLQRLHAVALTRKCADGFLHDVRRDGHVAEFLQFRHGVIAYVSGGPVLRQADLNLAHDLLQHRLVVLAQAIPFLHGLPEVSVESRGCVCKIDIGLLRALPNFHGETLVHARKLLHLSTHDSKIPACEHIRISRRGFPCLGEPITKLPHGSVKFTLVELPLSLTLLHNVANVCVQHERCGRKITANLLNTLTCFLRRCLLRASQLINPSDRFSQRLLHLLMVQTLRASSLNLLHAFRQILMLLTSSVALL